MHGSMQYDPIQGQGYESGDLPTPNHLTDHHKFA